MSIQVQGRVQALYGVYAANEARARTPLCFLRKARRSVRFSTA